MGEVLRKEDQAAHEELDPYSMSLGHYEVDLEVEGMVTDLRVAAEVRALRRGQF